MNRHVAVLLNDIRSVHNVGSVFRTSDALGIAKIYLSGHSPTPLDRFGNRRKDLAKVALGAENSVSWEYVADAARVVARERELGARIVAVEQAPNSIDYKKVVLDNRTLVIFGNEVDGVKGELLRMADVLAEIPMRGEKESLNVSVSFAVALYRMLGL